MKHRSLGDLAYTLEVSLEYRRRIVGRHVDSTVVALVKLVLVVACE